MNYEQFQKGWDLFECPLAADRTFDLVYFTVHPANNRQIYSKSMLQRLPLEPEDPCKLERKCPITRCPISLVNTASALPFRNVFLVITRNAVINTPEPFICKLDEHQFKYKEDVQNALALLNTLSAHEIRTAESALAECFQMDIFVGMSAIEQEKLKQHMHEQGNNLLLEPWQIATVFDPSIIGLNPQLQTLLRWKEINQLEPISAGVSEKLGIAHRIPGAEEQARIANARRQAEVVSEQARSNHAVLYRAAVAQRPIQACAYIDPILFQPGRLD